MRVFEQESLGGAIAHYPRGKVVMTEQIEMPRYGRFGKALLSKEELMAELNRLVHKNQVVIEEGQKVERIDGDAPFFSVTTGKGEKVQCRAVLVVGGGDSAVEAAIQLAEESTAKVAISYRGKSFTRCKPVSYTHLDVYKRQKTRRCRTARCPPSWETAPWVG